MFSLKDTAQLTYIGLRALPKALPILITRLVKGRREPFSAAIDVTSACNLRCTHCYLYRIEDTPYAMNKLPQLSDEEWLERLTRLKVEHPYILHVTWVGGEPLMRRQLLEKGTRLFLLNWIVTNGTYSIPDHLTRTVFVVSLDGPEEHHDELRGRGKYRIARTNVMSTRAPVYAHCVITRRNKKAVRTLVDEWHGTRLRGIRFSFYTPAYGSDDPLWLTPQERDEMVDEIVELRTAYGPFIWMTSDELAALRSEKQLEIFGDKCALKKGWDLALDHKGRVKSPCVMGEHADCTRCGCTVAPMVHSILKGSSNQTLVTMMRTFVG